MTDFQALGVQIGNLVSEKQEAYGDSYGKSGKVLEVLYPDGVRVDQYPTFLAVTRVIDKLFRVATKKNAFGESPWRDIAGYALLGIAADEKPVFPANPWVGELLKPDPIPGIAECIDDYAKRFGIPVDHPAPDADVDLMGLRILRNSDPCDQGVL